MRKNDVSPPHHSFFHCFSIDMVECVFWINTIFSRVLFFLNDISFTFLSQSINIERGYFDRCICSRIHLKVRKEGLKRRDRRVLYVGVPLTLVLKSKYFCVVEFKWNEGVSGGAIPSAHLFVLHSDILMLRFQFFKLWGVIINMRLL